MIAELIGALIAVGYGCCTVFRKKTPLFYRIIFFAMITCLMGCIYTMLYGFLWQGANSDFHVGYLAYVGMFFFLYSSYYGALDSLADGGSSEHRRFRMIAGATAGAFFAAAALQICFFQKGFWLLLLVIPASFTLYFSVKHLIIPDVEMGIIKVMRSYNAVVIALCICMMMRILSTSGSMIETGSSVCAGILLALCMPVARKGVQKWFI